LSKEAVSTSIGKRGTGLDAGPYIPDAVLSAVQDPEIAKLHFAKLKVLLTAL
jgi:hypothetical protein